MHGSGLNPGNLSGVLPLALSGMSRTIDRITLQERADWSFYDSTAITFDNMAFGQPVEDISPTTNDFLAFNSGIFTDEVWLLADALNAGIDEVTATVEAVAANDGPPDLRSRAARRNHCRSALELGRPARRRDPRRDRGAVDRRRRVPVALAQATARLDADHRGRPDDAHPLPGDGRRLRGASMVRARHAHPTSRPRMQILNAVPAVCAAPPGFATMADLPLIRSGAGFRKGPRP